MFFDWWSCYSVVTLGYPLTMQANDVRGRVESVSCGVMIPFKSLRPFIPSFSRTNSEKQLAHGGELWVSFLQKRRCPRQRHDEPRWYDFIIRR